jgi:predicted TPR repeat methyltransferase
LAERDGAAAPFFFSEMNDSTTIRRNPNMALAPGEDGYLVYDIKAQKLHRLNATASLIVELCGQDRRKDQLAADVGSLVGTDGAMACLSWLNRGLKEGILIDAAEARARTPTSALEFASFAQTLREEGYVLGAFVCQYHATLQLPSEADEWYALGELAHIVGRREDARHAYEQYISLEPGDAEIEQILIALRDGTPPSRAPDRCIQQLYARFSEFYEENMCRDLGYQAPQVLSAALNSELRCKKNLEMLELGCGTGLAAMHLRPAAGTLTGIDLSPEMIAHAQKKGLYDALEVAEITLWLEKAEPSGFDVIVACDTLIYFGDLSQVLLPAARVLREHGMIGFTVERDISRGFHLTDSGRYSHSSDHIRDAALTTGLVVKNISSAILRYEYGEEVVGLVVVLQKPAK